MTRPHTIRDLRRAVLGMLLACVAGCSEAVRVPLAVPLAPVGGSRPAGPQGIHVAAEFGDGVWGQEQERAELAGAALGFSVGDRVEFLISAHSSTRSVEDSYGNQNTGEVTTGLRGKVRLGDFRSGRATAGIQVAYVSAQRVEGTVQNERMSGLDVAVPVEFYPIGGTLVDYRLGIYAAPRLVLQSFEDVIGRATTTGTMAAAVVGLAGRWRYFALSGELNFAKTPTMTFGNTTFPSGVHVLPMMGVRGIIPIGR